MNLDWAQAALLELVANDSRFGRGVDENTGEEFALGEMRGLLDAEVRIIPIEELGIGEYGLLVRLESRGLNFTIQGEELKAFFNDQKLILSELGLSISRNLDFGYETWSIYEIVDQATSWRRIVASAEGLAKQMDKIETEISSKFAYTFDDFI